MNLMAWSEHFVSGIDAVDNQHKALVDMINAAAPHLASGGEEAQRTVGPLLDRLVRYAASHFRYEEDLMRQSGVLPAYLAQHVRTHEGFVEEVTRMRAQYERGEALGGKDLLQFLTSWLSFHILSEDKRMANQVLAIGRGETAQGAFDALDASRGAPQAVYNAALLDLFALLTARNRTLAQANEQVREAQRALEDANRSLEARVQERTQELAAANTALQAERQALVQSIEQLRQAQAQLLQSEKMAAVGQLAAGVAHEVNNPIGFVSSNIGSLSRYVSQLLALVDAYEQIRPRMPAPLRAGIEGLQAHAELAYIREDAPALLQDCRDGLARVRDIVQALRDYTHVDAADWAPADLNGLLDNALQVTGNELRFKADVVKELAPLPPVPCIASQVGQALVNLLLNAAQAIEGHGRITVRTGVADGGAWVEVADTGVGMAPEVQKRIFEPFFTTRPVGQGSGLGLSVAWDIVARHRGRLEVDSSAGQGARFRITLPLEQGAAPPMEETHAT